MGRKEAADALVEDREGYPEKDERKQEVRHRQAEEADERDGVVLEAVLTHRGVDADGDRERPSHQRGAACQDDGHEQPLADDLPDRLPEFQGYPQVEVQELPRPLGILHYHRLVQAVLNTEGSFQLGGSGA